MKVALNTIGCKLNQAETEKIRYDLLLAGHAVVDADASPDVYILNTCTVTAAADAKCRAWLRQAHRLNPKARLIITGCYAQRVPKELACFDGVTVIAGNEEKLELVSSLGQPEGGVSVQLVPGRHAARTRSFIKIQDGCNCSCSYCIVPIVRGQEKSRPAEEIVIEIKSRVENGCREVVLTGTEVGAYHDGFGLSALLQRILGETGISRIRLSSLQPAELTPALLDLWRDERLCPHFHISLQSGSDSVLRRMKRSYSTGVFHRALESIRQSVADVSITTDIIVGFPGETDVEFNESFDFCRNAGFARIHVFPYSVRPGTEAATMAGQVESRVKKARSQTMLALARTGAKDFHKGFIGRTMPVLWESSKTGIWSGLTPNYLKVFTEVNKDMTNVITPAHLTSLKADGLWSPGDT